MPSHRHHVSRVDHGADRGDQRELDHADRAGKHDRRHRGRHGLGCDGGGGLGEADGAATGAAPPEEDAAASIMLRESNCAMAIRPNVISSRAPNGTRAHPSVQGQTS